MKLSNIKLSNIKCKKCKKRIIESGALLFGPPKRDVCKKIHICKECYKRILL